MIVSANSSARDEDVEKLVRVAGVAEPPDQTFKPCLTDNVLICCTIQKEKKRKKCAGTAIIIMFLAVSSFYIVGVACMQCKVVA